MSESISCIITMKYLLERLVRIADIDNEKLLLKFRNRVNRVGIKMPTIEVRFEHIKIKAEVHVGKRASPTLTNYILDMVEAILNYILRRRRQQVNILKNKSNFVIDYYLKILGLETCADTVVGNAMLRGVSGGQRKRVTTGEMLVGTAKALFMDEISTGLDSSTTFQVVQSVKQSVHHLNGTAVISLLQPPPKTYDLFDDIILLFEGHIVYQDFLQEVTSMKDQEQYWAKRGKPYRFVTLKEFAEAFESFHVGRNLCNELVTQFDKSESHPATLATNKYVTEKWELFKACLSRELLLMKRNSFIYKFKLCQVGSNNYVLTTLLFEYGGIST
ncbi:pleiotropic drug resistance protein [Trifolium repens]|nr:pleiotropic drug resistance protein [Trifolium repens]